MWWLGFCSITSPCWLSNMASWFHMLDACSKMTNRFSNPSDEASNPDWISKFDLGFNCRSSIVMFIQPWHSKAHIESRSHCFSGSADFPADCCHFLFWAQWYWKRVVVCNLNSYVLWGLVNDQSESVYVKSRIAESNICPMVHHYFPNTCCYHISMTTASILVFCLSTCPWQYVNTGLQFNHILSLR